MSDCYLFVCLWVSGRFEVKGGFADVRVGGDVGSEMERR